MGKLTLLLVGATILGGSLLTLSTRQLAGESEKGLREQHADLLSRQIAESGHAVVLASIIGDAGFKAASDKTESYEGGTYRVEYSPASTSNRATFVVAGDYAGATHTIESTYEWDPMNYPGPVWLDVPYVTTSAHSSAEISGGKVQFDRRKHDALGLQSLAGLGPMESSLGSEVAKTGAAYNAGMSAGSWPGMLEDLNVQDGEDLYQAALTQAPETVIAGPLVVTNNRSNIGEKDEVTHVTGDLLIATNARFRGEGALVVDGSLEVQDKGVFEWRGIVIVRDEEQFLPVKLNGDVEITGGLVVVQHAYPPGGHMDVTTWRDVAAGISSSNVRGAGTSAPWNDTAFPWLQHKHRFDEDLGTRRVSYLNGGNAVPSQEAWTRFEDTIDQLGSEDIYLEFQNVGRHGYGVYTLDVDGMSEPQRGAVRDGFGAYARGSNGARFQTRTFAADDLNDFAVDIRSLRTLQDRFDGQGGCGQWPFCIGERTDRGGALRVGIKKASTNRTVYESALYWHMKAEDWTEYQAKEDAWRSQIQNGGLFGTRLELGKKADIAFEIRPILDLVERLGFDGNEVIHVGTETSHRTRAQSLALATRPDGKIEVCHNPTSGGNTVAIHSDALNMHLQHGDRLMACDGTPANAGASTPAALQAPPNCLTAPVSIAICNKPGGNGLWKDRDVSCTSVVNHLAHGCRLGSCALNGLPTTDS
ncbi:hypothetical protein [Rubricoccus marinus]|uniref:Uncharacterized protein n=1 Tax=Rubricoccus marinus TaxID=716817 RepID=A0A259TYQ7_9BACT|nr:hypothetical protein [Rubricoccus marinus]OZC02879.1 hypothetical protein BSZ36_07780 [Rubricoccus marinus]